MHKSFCLSLLVIGLAVTPALAQNRFADEAKEQAARRSENAAVRDTEHPTTKTATTQQPNTQKPAGSQPPAAPTDTTAPANTQPAPAPAPAQ